MRSEENPLDLNNLPEDYTRDGRQASEDSSSSAGAGGVSYRKKNGAEEGKSDDSSSGAKVYECRFCSLKFCKSQALGGHMNRHRQERETETLNKARQLVFTNDLAPGHIGYVSGNQPISHGGYHQASNIGDTTLPFRSMYPARLFSTIPPPPPPLPPPSPPQTAPFMYTSPSRLLSFPSQYPAPPNDYFLGHVLSNPTEGNYTCIGAPVGHAFPNGGTSGGIGGGGGGGGGVRDMSMMNQEEGLNWGRR